MSRATAKPSLIDLINSQENIKLFAKNLSIYDKDEIYLGLKYAASQKKDEHFKLLLENFKDKTKKDKQDFLSYIILNNDIEVLRACLRTGNLAKNGGIKFLRFAAENNKAEIIDFLVKEAGFDINARDKDNLNALYYAINSNNFEAAQALIKNGVNINFRYKKLEGITALQYAIRLKHKNFVNLLLSQEQIDVNTQDEFKSTPLFEAVYMHDNSEILENLLKRGADITIKNNQNLDVFEFVYIQGKAALEEKNFLKYLDLIIQYASQEYCKDLVRRIVIDEKNEEIDILSHIISAGYLGIAYRLVEKSSHVNGNSDVKVTRPIISLVQLSKSKESILLLRLMIDKGASVNDVTLLAALSARNYAAVDILLEHGSNLINDNVLELAFNYKNLDVLIKLLANGIDVKKARELLQTYPFKGNEEFFAKANELFEAFEDSSKVYEGKKAIYIIAEHGNVATLQKHLTSDDDLSQKDDKGATLMHYAAKGNKAEIIKYLASCKADCNSKVAVESRNGQIIEALPIHVAVDCGNHEVLEQLITLGANIDAQDSLGWTAVHLAVKNSDVVALKMLFENPHNKAQINIRNNTGLTPFHIAICNKTQDDSTYYQTLNYLLNAGADINSQDKDGETLLHWAVKDNNVDIVTFLVNKGINVNLRTEVEFSTALHKACEDGLTEVVKILLESKNIDIEILDKDGFSALRFAAQEGEKEHEEITKMLLLKGADVTKLFKNGKIDIGFNKENAKVIELLNIFYNPNLSNENGETALHLAIANKAFLIAEKILQKGANIEAEIRSIKTTPLISAIKNNNLAMVVMLLKKGANVNHCDAIQSPAHYALKNCENSTDRESSLEILKYLAAFGADFSIKNARGTSVAEAVKTSAVEELQEIVEAFQRPKRTMLDGSSALHWFARSNNVASFKEFVEKGADINLKDNQGNSALYYALLEGNVEIVKYCVLDNIDKIDEEEIKKIDTKLLSGDVLKAIKSYDDIKLAAQQEINRRVDEENTKYFKNFVNEIADNAVNQAEVKKQESRRAEVARKALKSWREYAQKKRVKNEEIAQEIVQESIIGEMVEKSIDVVSKELFEEFFENITNKVVDDLNNELVSEIAGEIAGEINQLLLAVKNDDCEQLIKLLEKDPTLLNQTFKSDNLLHIAAFNKSEKIVDFLLKKNQFDVFAKNSQGKNIFELLEKSDESEYAKKLRNYLNEKLLEAVKNKNHDLIEILLENGANPNFARLGKNALCEAIANDDKKAAEILIKNGADINSPLEHSNRADSQTALHFATLHKKAQMLEFLFANGGNIFHENSLFNFASNAIKPTLIAQLNKEMFKAIKSADIKSLEFCLTNGADANAVNEQGDSALYFATRYNNDKACEILLENGANPNFVNQDGYPLIIGAAIYEDGFILKQLIAKNADVNLRNNNGNSALQMAMLNLNFDNVKTLIENGATLDYQDLKFIENHEAEEAKEIISYLQQILFQRAFAQRNYDEVINLLENGADVNSKLIGENQGFSMLYAAIAENDLMMARIFLKYGADFTSLEPDNRNCEQLIYEKNNHPLISALNDAELKMPDALHRMAHKGNDNALEMLIKNGVNVNYQNIENLPAIFYALLSSPFNSTAKMLLDNGAKIDMVCADGVNLLDKILLHETSDLMCSRLQALGFEHEKLSLRQKHENSNFDEKPQEQSLSGRISPINHSTLQENIHGKTLS